MCVCANECVGRGVRGGRSKLKQSRQGNAKQCEEATLNLIIINWY